MKSSWLALVLTALLLHCGGGENADPAPPIVAADSSAPDVVTTTDAGSNDAAPAPRDIPTMLSGYGLFTGGPDPAGHLTPVAGTVPYELTTALFSDYALKSRTMTIPAGTSAGYQPDAVFDFPVGTIFSKTFAFPADLRQPAVGVRLVETRIPVHQPSGWEAYPYLWNAEQTDATLVPGGRVVPTSLVDLEGSTRAFDYLVESRNQCQQCHHLLDDQGNQVMHPIGPKARYLNRDNQLQNLASRGQLSGLPVDAPRAPNALDPSDGTLETRARTYLDINCAHCHNPRGTAGTTSNLFLQHDATDPFQFGVCKRPGSAGSDQGGEFDILPGDSMNSILWNRIHTTESGRMMPQIGRAILHDEGAQLVADWIDAMPPAACK